MKILKVEDYNDFICIGNECPFSCCEGGWRIAVDEESRNYYLSVDGEFGEKLRDNIEKEAEGTYKFKMKSDGECAFLDKDRLCEMYKKLGPDKLCEVCKTHPRCSYWVGDILFCYLDTTCPEVTRRIFQRKAPMVVDYGDTADYDVEEGNIDWQQFNFAIRAYTVGMAVLQNRNFDVRERLALLMIFVKQFQESVRMKSDPTALIKLFSEPELYSALLQDIPIYERDDLIKIRAFQLIYEHMRVRSYDHPLWKQYNELAMEILHIQSLSIKDLNEAFLMLDEEQLQLEMEQILTYKYFVLFMPGFEKQDYYERLAVECVKFSAYLSYVVYSKLIQGHTCLQKERILFYSLCSRARENSFRENVEQEGLNSLESIFRLISS